MHTKIGWVIACIGMLVMGACGAYDMDTIQGDVNYCLYEQSNNAWCQEMLGTGATAIVSP